MIELTVTEIVRDEGTVVLFRGDRENGSPVTFAVDRRPAYDIANALAAGEFVEVEIESWQVVGY
jgi:hypothetical protein